MASRERILGGWVVAGFCGVLGAACSSGEGGREETSFGSHTSMPVVTTQPPEDETTTSPSTGDESSSTGDDTTGVAEASTMHVGVCGDGTMDEGEECDDGNIDDTDACLTACVLASCGDGFVQLDVEACDDGDDDDTDECLSTCAVASCGDGAVQADVEACDDGNDVETDACLSTCEAAKCGDSVVQEGVEACDDGNLVELDTCSNSCAVIVPEKSCKGVLALAPDATNGVYSIDPDGEGGEDAIKAYCDMTQDGGGWTLILNRNVNSDNTGQPDLGDAHGSFDNTRASNWNFDIDLFWADATQVVFADKQNDNCNNCAIAQYHSAIRVERAAAPAYASACGGVSTMVSALKLVGPMAGNMGMAFQCAASLGWGNCGGSACHLGVHSKNTATDNDWGGNMWNEMHFPTSNSMFASFGDVANDPTAYRRGCGGGLASNFNSSSSCGLSMQSSAKARWTVWVR
jgi:cysteine-rich repeat protein